MNLHDQAEGGQRISAVWLVPQRTPHGRPEARWGSTVVDRSTPIEPGSMESGAWLLVAEGGVVEGASTSRLCERKTA